MKTKHPVDSQDARAFWGTRSEASGSNSPKRRRRPLVTTPAPGKRRKPQTLSDQPAAIAVAMSNGELNGTTRSADGFEYDGHMLRVEPHRNGWKVAIFPKGSPFALHRGTYVSELAEQDAVIAEAKAVVDAASPKKTSPEVAMEQTDMPISPGLDFVSIFLRFQRPLMQWFGETVSAAKRAYFSIDSRSH